MEIGSYVIKDSGDYTFEGWIIAVFKKRSGAIRYAIENKEGIVLIMNEKMFHGL